jgi:hypothetical protein
MVGVVLSLLILSVALSIYLANVQYSQFEQSTYYSQALNLSDDFTRVLTDILAGATLTYNSTADIVQPRIWAYTNFTDWAMATHSAYALNGIQTSFTFTNVSLGAGMYTNNSLIKLFWYGPTALSAISAAYQANFTGQGLYGLQGSALMLLNTSVDTAGIANVGTASTAINLTVNREYGIPVDDLTKKSFVVDYFDNNSGTWQTAKIASISRQGGGHYTLYIQNNAGFAVPDPYEHYLILFIQDKRGIMTESYTYNSIQYVFNEHAVAPFFPRSTFTGIPYLNETYTMESLSNGSVMWFGNMLQFGGTANQVPIPIPPVKQLRVYTNNTVLPNGTLLQGVFNVAPSQVEQWTANYSYPTLSFANWRSRFERNLTADIGDKLVYLVNFANATTVAVNITWLTDADAAPPQYLINISTSSGFVDINNGVYTMRLLNNVSLSLSIDYSVSMMFNGYHIESELNAVGWIPSQGWEPHILPGGDWNDSTTTSFIIDGPVRAVAFRSSNNDTQFNYQNGRFVEQYLVPGPFTHTDIFLIPYNTPYVELFETYNWTQQYNDSQLLNLITLIAGVSTSNNLPADPNSRPTNWAYLHANGTVQGGAFLNPNTYPHGSGDPPGLLYDTNISNFGDWFTEYNNSIGEAIIGGNNLVSAIAQLTPPNQAVMNVWNSYDGDRDAFWAAQVQPWGSGTMTVKPQVVSYSAAIWTYNGFVGSNLSLLSPNIYYRMFLTQFYPTVNASSVS